MRLTRRPYFSCKQGNGTLARPAHDSEGWNSDSESRGNKTLANKQLHSVAKQFGSLGRSVGRRLKRNLMENFTIINMWAPYCLGFVSLSLRGCFWSIQHWLV